MSLGQRTRSSLAECPYPRVSHNTAVPQLNTGLGENLLPTSHQVVGSLYTLTGYWWWPWFFVSEPVHRLLTIWQVASSKQARKKSRKVWARWKSQYFCSDFWENSSSIFPNFVLSFKIFVILFLSPSNFCWLLFSECSFCYTSSGFFMDALFSLNSMRTLIVKILN